MRFHIAFHLLNPAVEESLFVGPNKNCPLLILHSPAINLFEVSEKKLEKFK